MLADLLRYDGNDWQGIEGLRRSPNDYALVFAFADRPMIQDGRIIDELRKKFPAAEVVVGTTAGEILQKQKGLESLVVSALQFDHTRVQVACGNIADAPDSFELGKKLAGQLPTQGLKYVFLLSDGNKVNGSQLGMGVNIGLPSDVLVTGGMAGDGDRFQMTLTGHNDNIAEGNVILVGFYGDRIQVGYGTRGGWLFLGPDRTITSSSSNVLYEIDGQPALDLYKRYLGSFSDELPSSALLFPLALLPDDSADAPLVRTILSIDEANKSMIFAGDVPTGARVRLMRAGLQELVDAAGEVGAEARTGIQHKPDFAMVMNCVGRRLVLGHRADEEIESIRTGLDPDTPLIGFYTYGEFSPAHRTGISCDLHNQTVVLTIFEET